MTDGSIKMIMESNVGDMVKAVDTDGQLIDSEIIEIIHKDLNSSSKFFKNFIKRNFYILHFFSFV